MGFIGSLFSGPKQPQYIPPTPAVSAPTPATTADPSGLASGQMARSTAAAAAGLGSTIKTSAQGAAATPVGTKSLLGQ